MRAIVPPFAQSVKPRGVVAIGHGRDYIWAMREKDIIDILGPPDVVADPVDRKRSREWQCSRCKLTITNDNPFPVPAPCPVCGGIAFEAIEPPPN